MMQLIFALFTLSVVLSVAAKIFDVSYLRYTMKFMSLVSLLSGMGLSYLVAKGYFDTIMANQVIF
jgi:hypothetical protein